MSGSLWVWSLLGGTPRKLQASTTPRFRCTEPYSSMYVYMGTHSYSLLLRSFLHLVPSSSLCSRPTTFQRDPGLLPSLPHNSSLGELEETRHFDLVLVGLAET
jgi:hypothetical protein